MKNQTAAAAAAIRTPRRSPFRFLGFSLTPDSHVRWRIAVSVQKLTPPWSFAYWQWTEGSCVLANSLHVLRTEHATTRTGRRTAWLYVHEYGTEKEGHAQWRLSTSDVCIRFVFGVHVSYARYRFRCPCGDGGRGGGTLSCTNGSS